MLGNTLYNLPETLPTHQLRKDTSAEAFDVTYKPHDRHTMSGRCGRPGIWGLAISMRSPGSTEVLAPRESRGSVTIHLDQ